LGEDYIELKPIEENEVELEGGTISVNDAKLGVINDKTQ
jgi:hypothetical protein